MINTNINHSILFLRWNVASGLPHCVMLWDPVYWFVCAGFSLVQVLNRSRRPLQHSQTKPQCSIDLLGVAQSGKNPKPPRIGRSPIDIVCLNNFEKVVAVEFVRDVAL